MKKVLQNLLVLVMLLSYGTVFAYDFEVDGIYYNIIREYDEDTWDYVATDNVEVTCSDNGYEGDIVIPEMVENNGIFYKVTAIGEGGFRYQRINSIILPKTLESIGGGAFDRTEITSIIIPSNVKFIGGSAFEYCQLKNIEFEESMAEEITIGGRAFFGCLIKEITLPSTLKVIEDETFISCVNLEKVVLPEGLEKIGYRAFGGTQISELKIPSSLRTLSGGALRELEKLITIELPNSLEVLPEGLFELDWNLQYIKLGNNVSKIDRNIIGKSYFTEYSLPAPIIQISTPTPPVLSAEAFPEELLSDIIVILPNAEIEEAYRKAKNWDNLTFTNQANVVEINVQQPGDLSFELIIDYNMAPAKVYGLKINGEINEDDFNQMRVNMHALSNLDLTNCTITEIPDGAMTDKVTLQSLNLQTKLTKVGRNAFNGCRLLDGTLSLPFSLRTIDDHAFKGTGISSLNFNSTRTLSAIGDEAFANTKIEGQLRLPTSVKTIGESAFANNNISGHLTLHDGIISLGANAFADNDIATIFLPNSITELSEGVLQNNPNLNTLYIPDNIHAIGNYALANCAGMVDLRLSSKLEEIGEYALSNLAIDYLIIPEKIDVLNRGVLSNCNSLVSLTLPAGLNSIESDALRGCRGMLNLACYATVPPTISNASSIQGINIDKCVLAIPTDSFRDYALSEYWGRFVQMRNNISLEQEGNGTTSTGTLTGTSPHEMHLRAVAMDSRALAVAAEREGVVMNDGQSVYVPTNGLINFYFVPEEGEELLSVTLDGIDIMPEIINGVFTTTANKRNAKLVVKYSGVITGIDNIDSIVGTEPCYYNLQGIRVKEPTDGIFIVHRGNQITKEYISR